MTTLSDAGSGDGQLPESVLRKASDWHMRVQDDPNDLDLRARLNSWLASEPAHQAAWSLLERSIKLTRQTPPAHAADWRVAPTGLPPLEASARKRPTRQPSRILTVKRAGIGAVAAGLVAVLFGPQVMLQLRADQVTGTAQSRDLALLDGSRIALGAQSAITESFGGTYRRIGLLQGEAYFDVAHDGERPFTVQAADMTVTVTGTAFDVSMTQASLDVSVARGSVRVEQSGENPLTVALKPGQRLTIDRETGRSSLIDVSLIEIGAWRSGRLAVRNATIAEVAEFLDRHFQGHIFLREGALKSARVTGVYDLNDPVGSLKTLLSSGGARMTRISPWIIVVAPG